MGANEKNSATRGQPWLEPWLAWLEPWLEPHIFFLHKIYKQRALLSQHHGALKCVPLKYFLPNSTFYFFSSKPTIIKTIDKIPKNYHP